MKKEIINFPIKTQLSLTDDFFILQTDSGIQKKTYKTTLSAIKDSVLDQLSMLISSGPGISTTFDATQGQWLVTNTSKASDIVLVAGDGIMIQQNSPLVWQIYNTSKASDIVLVAGEGIGISQHGLNWVITNTDPVTDENSLIDFEIIAGDNIVIRRNKNKWLISALHRSFELCSSDCDIEGILNDGPVPCDIDLSSSII